jgi:hypothetical protein
VDIIDGKLSKRLLLRRKEHYRNGSRFSYFASLRAFSVLPLIGGFDLRFASFFSSQRSPAVLNHQCVSVATELSSISSCLLTLALVFVEFSERRDDYNA